MKILTETDTDWIKLRSSKILVLHPLTSVNLNADLTGKSAIYDIPNILAHNVSAISNYIFIRSIESLLKRTVRVWKSSGMAGDSPA